MTTEIITSPSRTANLCAMRMVICHQLRTAGLTLSQIGKKINRNHSTVVHSLRRFEDLMSVNDPILLEAITKLSFQQRGEDSE